MFAEKQAPLCRIGAVAGLFVLAGILNRACAALPALLSAVCFLLSSLSYVALALAWGFSVSSGCSAAACGAICCWAAAWRFCGCCCAR